MCMMPHTMDHSEHEAAHASHSESSAFDILKRRFAQGEITPEQFKEMAQVLSTAEMEFAQSRHQIHGSS